MITLGQGIGNNFFFMVSGFVLVPSIERAAWRDFPKWYLKRLMRILPITAIAYAAAYLMGYYSFSDRAQLVAVFIYPTLYWFITCILIFYIFLFIIAKTTGFKFQGALCMLLAVLYVALNGRQERLYVLGLLSMTAGYMLRVALDASKQTVYLKTASSVLAIAAVVFILTDIAELRHGTDYLISTLLCVSSQAVCLSALAIGYMTNDKLEAVLSERRLLKGAIRYIGDMALPIYIVQCFCSGYIGFWIGLHIDFPLSFPVNFIVVWSLGTVLLFISRGAMRLYSKK